MIEQSLILSLIPLRLFLLILILPIPIRSTFIQSLKICKAGRIDHKAQIIFLVYYSPFSTIIWISIQTTQTTIKSALVRHHFKSSPFSLIMGNFYNSFFNCSPSKLFHLVQTKIVEFQLPVQNLYKQYPYNYLLLENYR